MQWFRRLFARRKPPGMTPAPLRPPQFVLAAECLTGLAACFEHTAAQEHEGIAYLLGRADTEVTLAVAAIRPEARTTRGSFEVGSAAMARVVRTASDCGLQVVGQVHSHPGDAFHSDGDVAGARIRYYGYVSIVVPEYGRRLPDLCGAACYVFVDGRGFVPFEAAAIAIVPGRMP